MRQLIQNLKTGETILEEVPIPTLKGGCVLIQTTYSLVSLGTEKSLVEFGKAGLIAKARQQPDKVKMVLEKIKSDGVVPTLEAVFNKLNQPLPLGYCNVGKIIGIGAGVSDFNIGDRVVSNGAHAEFVNVPVNLVSTVPEEVSDEEAAFTVVGAIGMQGIRLVNPTLGETIVVIGLGLIGLITAQLLKANGCHVIGVDFDESKLSIAKEMGIQTLNPNSEVDQVEYVMSETLGVGADAVIITASSKSNDIISNAAKMSRKKGRIILVGVVGLDLSRAEFYEKELIFQVSCSYGPGRYDESYEQKGVDYPIGHVRWTEKRNFLAILNAIKHNQINVKKLISEVIDLEDYMQVYGAMGNNQKIASVLKYKDIPNKTKTIQISNTPLMIKNKGVVGIIGAGNFTSAALLPALKSSNLSLKYIASASGLSAKNLANKHNIQFATSDYKEILKDDQVDMVMITVRHNLHAQIVIDSLEAGKHVFVEKPLCLDAIELDDVIEAHAKSGKSVVVGFNRRFAPFASKMKELVSNAPINITATMNAGFIPASSWVHSLEEGGGRIIGEACHFIDLCSFLTGSEVVSVCANSLGVNPKENSDNLSILLKYRNGSNAVINYFANGSKSYSKERVEIFSLGKTIIMDNWRSLEGFGYDNLNKISSKQDKGHKNQFQKLSKSMMEGSEEIISFNSIVNTTRSSFAIIQSLKTSQWVSVEV